MRKVSLDYNFAMREHITDGITSEELNEHLNLANEGLIKLSQMVEKGEVGFPKLVESDISDLLNFVKEGAGRYDDVIVIGIGGSSLGFEAITNGLLPYGYNCLSKDKRGFFPRFWVMDNVDSFKVYWILKHCDPDRTLAIVISKSGSTVETAANFLIVYKWFNEHAVDLKDHLVAITDPVKGDLRKIVGMLNILAFTVPPNVGGRYSVLSAVGLLPAALVGVDIKRILEGAAYFIHNGKNIYLTMTAIYNIYLTRGKNINVIMPYSSRLKSFSEWFNQLWGESLGKRYDLSGREVYFGSTPVGAVGTIDQHSQLQLYKEGPFDKFITFLELSKHDFNLDLDGSWYENYNYLDGVDLNRLLNTELYATEAALKKASRASMKVVVDYLDEFSMGYLFMLYQYVVATLGIINNINPFDQPGVEEGKDYAYGILNRKGYDEKRKEFESFNRRDRDFIIE
ncbi:MAG: glucose-6-phosphate isomerase [Calditerrivibrio sp.]|nr:glucose-6-phosphate isomerase [Calditerrivibrio sp.]